MSSIGVTEILVILAIVLLLFGGKKIPELMKGLGSRIKEFKNAAKDGEPADKKEETKVAEIKIAKSEEKPARKTAVAKEEKEKKPVKTTAKKTVAKKSTTKKEEL